MTVNIFGKHETVLGEGFASLDINDVGAQQGSVESVSVTKKFFDPVVELVVADICGVISHQVEGSSHDFIAAESFGLLR